MHHTNQYELEINKYLGQIAQLKRELEDAKKDVLDCRQIITTYCEEVDALNSELTSTKKALEKAEADRAKAESDLALSATRTYTLQTIISADKIVLEKAKTLVDRLEFIHEDPLFKTVWFSAFNHGIDYTNGPKYDKELAELKEALAIRQNKFQ
jgi:chromosome segregation ATPase